MTVSNTAFSTIISGNGVQTVFAYSFEIPYQDDGITPAVVVSTTISKVVTVLSTSQFSITGVGNPTGGTVTYTGAGTPLPAGASITIARAKTITQPYAFPNHSLLPSTVEAALDNVVLEMQQLVGAQAATVTPVVVYVDDYGAVPNGSTDCADAFDYCLNNFHAVRWGAGTYRLSRGITIPAGRDAGGVAGLANENGATGSTLLFDLSVSHCVTMIGGGSNETCNFHDTAVTRAAGAIPAGSIGVYLNTGYNCAVDNVSVTRQAQGFYFLSAGVNGIAAKATRLYTGAISDAHLVADTWPELHISQSRFGANGSIDLACNAYVRITGGGLGGAGCNGIFFTQCQFNSGGGLVPIYFTQVVNVSHTDSNTLEFKYHQCHIEGVSGAIFFSDSSCVYLNRLNFTDNTVNCPGTPMFALNAGTQPADWSIHGNQLYVSTFLLAPTVGFSKIAITNNVIPCTGQLTCASGTISLANNNWNALTIAGAGNFSIIGDRMTSGAFTNSCTGSVTYINPDGPALAWTPSLKFGGGSTGMTYSLQVGEYQSVGSYATVSFGITLTAKGSSTGSATISGLPRAGNASFGASGGSAASYALNLSGLTSAVTISAAGASTSLNLYHTGTTGVVALTHGNFSDTSSIYGTIIYPV